MEYILKKKWHACLLPNYEAQLCNLSYLPTYPLNVNSYLTLYNVCALLILWTTSQITIVADTLTFNDKAMKNKCIGSHQKKKKNDEGKRFSFFSFFLFFFKLKNKCFASHQFFFWKMTKASENAMSSEKCMHFTCFTKLSIWWGTWLFFCCCKN